MVALRDVDGGAPFVEQHLPRSSPKDKNCGDVNEGRDVKGNQRCGIEFRAIIYGDHPRHCGERQEDREC
jgi:hypothetical protein